MKSRLLTLITLTAATLTVAAQSFSLDRCRGSRMPYPAPDSVVAVPDTLSPVMIYHVGRHGARYATSPDRFLRVEAYLTAHSDKLTPRGKRLLEITRGAIDATADRWGQLDSLGIAEQQGIARRLCLAFPQLIVGHEVTAISSYVGRCEASMEAFTSTVRRMQSGLGSVSADSGRRYSYLMRPFSTDSAYVVWAKEKPYKPVLDAYTDSITPARKLLDAIMPGATYSDEDATEMAASVYYVVSSLAAMGLADADAAMELLTPDEYNALWRIDNLRQYLSRTQSTISTLPADIAAPLLQDMIDNTDGFISGKSDATVRLHFGHAETLMPLLSLMRLPGCYYLTHYFDTVADHWQTFNVVPMAANLQLILMRSRSGRYYVRFDLNERPVSFGADRVYIPWTQMRAHLQQLAGG